MRRSPSALLLGLRFALIWVGIYLGLLVRDPQAVVAVQILVWPVGFLSSAFAAPVDDARLARDARRAQPASPRPRRRPGELFANPVLAGDSWIAGTRRAAGGAVAAAPHRGLRPAGGAALPAARGMSRLDPPIIRGCLGVAGQARESVDP